jgi:hypothetical protein
MVAIPLTLDRDTDTITSHKDDDDGRDCVGRLAAIMLIATDARRKGRR